MRPPLSSAAFTVNRYCTSAMDYEDKEKYELEWPGEGDADCAYCGMPLVYNERGCCAACGAPRGGLK